MCLHHSAITSQIYLEQINWEQKLHLLKRSKDKKLIKEEKRHDQENISCGFSVMSEVNSM